jgi:MoaA/NifB/PqqE/SkfB family radical SAM enzyme
MKFEVFTRLLDQFPNVHELQLQGLGEPMMHPRFADMVAYAVRKGITVTTNSNLTLLNPERAERCVTSGLSCIHVSIDGATAETYERIRVRSRFERVLRNLALVREARSRLGSATPALRMVSVLMRQNLHELPDLVRLAQSQGMRSLFVQHLCHDLVRPACRSSIARCATSSRVRRYCTSLSRSSSFTTPSPARSRPS